MKMQLEVLDKFNFIKSQGIITIIGLHCLERRKYVHIHPVKAEILYRKSENYSMRHDKCITLPNQHTRDGVWMQ